MKIDDFITEVLAARDKSLCMRNHIVTEYLPYAEKLAQCQKIAQASLYTVSEPSVFKQNTPLKTMLFSLSMFEKYTDIEIDFCHAFECFDTLDKYGLNDIILTQIPATEVIKMQGLLDMVIGDRLANERDLISFFETKVDALSMTLNTISEAFIEAQKKEDDLVE